MKETYYTGTEIQAFTLAKTIQKDQIVLVGTGLPLIGAMLAKRVLEPSCTLVVESGLMDFIPKVMPRSISDLRSMAHCSVPCPPYRYLGFQANALKYDNNNVMGFVGGAAVDPYGNVSATCIGDYHKPKTRFSGSGGANAIAAFVHTILVMQHEKRRFVEKLNYITSPGWLEGPGSREKCGLPPNRGPVMLVSELGVMKFDSVTKRMYVHGYYPSTSIEEIMDNTGFDMDTSRAIVLPEPDNETVDFLRAASKSLA